MSMSTRQPFGELGSPRLQALQSAKNRQNGSTPPAGTFSPLKPTSTPSTGKRRASSSFDDTCDSENVDPTQFGSPSKRSKTSPTDAGWIKPAKFSLASSKPSPALTTSPSIASVRRALSSPNTANSTPIGHSRGSPKHKRIGLLSKRRISTSPFRRVDPPSFSAQSSPAGLPFSIDAALSGTIPNYTPKPIAAATPVETPSQAQQHASASSLDDSMPKGWFFEIHEDTPEQEAANMMEHSASVLDISSDDDLAKRLMNEDRGKENMPPPNWALSQPCAGQEEVQSSAAVEDAMQTGEKIHVELHVKMPRLRNITQDAMDEDRKPLGDLPAAEFYGEGCDASSFVTVDPGLEKPSGLSKETDFSSTLEENEELVQVEAEKKIEELVEVEVEVEKKDDELLAGFKIKIETVAEVKPVDIEVPFEVFSDVPIDVEVPFAVYTDVPMASLQDAITPAATGASSEIRSLLSVSP